MFNLKRAVTLLGILCVLAYANTLFNGFISDDVTVLIDHSPNINELGQAWHNPQQAMHTLTYFFFKQNPLPYHLTSIVFHIIATVMVFLFLRYLFGLYPSLFAASLFAVHPAHCEAVAWISGRPYIIMTIFLLGSFFLYERSMSFLGQGKKASAIKTYILCVLFYTYFLLDSFSFYALFPFFIAIWDICFRDYRERWRWWIVFVLIVALRIFLAREFIADRITFVAKETTGSVLVVHNPLVYFVYSFFAHLWLLVWPRVLTLYHEPVFIPKFILHFKYLFAFGFLFVLWVLWKRSRRLFFALSIFIIFLSFTYSHIPVSSVVAERYVYFPLLAFSIFFACLYARLLEGKESKRPYILGFFILVLVVLLMRTAIRNTDWKSEEIFWTRTLETSPLSPRALNNYGVICLRQGNVKRAIEEFQKSLRINSSYADARNNLALVYSRQGFHSQAVSLLEASAKLAVSNQPQVYLSLGQIQLKVGQAQKAVASLKQAIKLDPGLFNAWAVLGKAYEASGDFINAQAAYKRSIDINPLQDSVYLDLANFYSTNKKPDQAIAVLRQALKQNPKFAEGYNQLGAIYFDLNNKEEAVNCFKKAIETNPEYIQGYNNLANVYNSMHKGKEAISVLQGALRIKPFYPVLHFNLAIAYLQEKDLPRARLACEKAKIYGYKVPQEFEKKLR
ncbi:MAG: tetratricopeptide repeat protein [Candidatus Omnitrophica bacterium]|jgi:tetratricopeptide (TPR) repeat protein|nr:tetratricopeptide repeat protein [Candidatus Omnitrophota bacterium]